MRDTPAPHKPFCPEPEHSHFQARLWRGHGDHNPASLLSSDEVVFIDSNKKLGQGKAMLQLQISSKE